MVKTFLKALIDNLLRITQTIPFTEFLIQYSRNFMVKG